MKRMNVTFVNDADFNAFKMACAFRGVSMSARIRVLAKQDVAIGSTGSTTTSTAKQTSKPSPAYKEDRRSNEPKTSR